ncbi:coiled-coil domain-containing protein 42 homolog [Odontesthes bonariensis]|uniref:coiled-coil domain-containing protein 42 homolog n=1 Tax=Odontesthes bonariensis TaxID=219752 RepID=UPI003F58AB4B
MFSKPKKSPPAGSGTASRNNLSMSELYAYTEFQAGERELKELRKTSKEREQYLENLRLRRQELQKEIKEQEEQRFNLLLKEREVDVAARKAARETREKEAKLEQQEQEYAEMAERKQELLREVQKYSVFKDFLEEVLKLTTFEDVDALTAHFENLLQYRDRLYERENQVQDQVGQQRKKLLKLKDQHELMLLQGNNQLSQLQTELQKARSEAQNWQRQWNHIQETAAKKTLELGQLKMATLNLFEQTGGVVGAEGVDISATDKQLEQIQMYIKDMSGIIKQYQTLLQRGPEGNNHTKTEKKSNSK